MKKAMAAIVSVLLLSGCASAPARNVSSARHPNLAAAQRFCADAFERLDQAQRANEWDLGGHAKRAKELLVQASDEIKLAAVAANHR
jgi:outer membrane murein-binding lipoprotein Lpp